MFPFGLPQRRKASTSSLPSSASKNSVDWIRNNITALECAIYIPVHPHHSVGPTSRCLCGRTLSGHCTTVQQEVFSQDVAAHLHRPGYPVNISSSTAVLRPAWHVDTHTVEASTNAYGVVEFQSGPHPSRAKYARLHYDTPPETVLHLLLHEWRVRVPNLVISVIGGLANSILQTRLQQVVYRGLLRAAKTTVAWVITNGLDIGVTRHVGDALGGEMHIHGSNIVTLGIAPWGYVQNRQELVGINKTCTYSMRAVHSGRQQDIGLHSMHNYFLFADDGTVGKFGSELHLRQRLEQYLAQEPFDKRRYGGMKSRIPIVGVLLEGDVHAFRAVLDLVTGPHPVPVVVCDGSGRAADILAFMHRYAGQDGELSRWLVEHLLHNLCETFHLLAIEAEGVYNELRQCMKGRHMISVYRMGKGGSEEIDITILTAMLQGHKLTPAEQLSLTMAWNRPDIAKSKVFITCPVWTLVTLEHALTDALLNDRVEFVRLLINKGLVIQRFLTVARLEELYVAKADANNLAFHKLFTKVMGKRTKVTLVSIGLLIEQLLGGGYQHNYCQIAVENGRHPLNLDLFPGLQSSPDVDSTWCTDDHDGHHPGGQPSLASSPRKSYAYTNSEQKGVSNQQTQQLHRIAAWRQHVTDNGHNNKAGRIVNTIFRYPYTELMQWALLTGRYEMARFMVFAGEQSIAKALFALKLLKCIQCVTVDEVDADLADDLKTQTQLFEQLAVDLQEHCYRDNADETKRLLTYELSHFSHHTCLSLAYFCGSKAFISHPCAQAILNDLWYGGLRKGRMVGAKTALLLISMALPPFYPFIVYWLLRKTKFLEFKTKKELAMQPQTLQEHLDELENSSTDSSSRSVSSKSSKRSVRRSHHSMRHQLFTSEQIASEVAGAATVKSEEPDSDSDIAVVVHTSSSPGGATSRPVDKDFPAVVAGTNNPLFNTACSEPNGLVNNADREHCFGVAPVSPVLPAPPALSHMSGCLTLTTVGGSGRPLSWRKRILVFFSAPVTRFYLHVLLYLVFLILYTGLSIHTLPIDQFSLLECYVYLYIITFFVDRFREVSLSPGTSLWHKFRVHLSVGYWNRYNMVLCVVSLVALALRYIGVLIHNVYMWGKNLLIICCAFWQLRFFEFMRMWRFSGAYTYMIFQMVCIMNPMLTLLLLPLIAFGTLRQGIMYPNNTSIDLTGIKGIVLKPYFMMYGEVYADEIDPVAWPEESLGAPFFEAVPIAMAVYMLYSMILFTSLVMATFRDVYAEVLEQSEQVYNFIRYAVIIDFDSRPLFPPPFIILSWIYNAVSSIYRSRRKRKKLHSTGQKRSEPGGASVGDAAAGRSTIVKWHMEVEKRELSVGLKLFLSQNEIAKLHTFEGECVDEYWRQHQLTENSVAVNKENVVTKRLDQLQMHMDELNLRQSQARSVLHCVDTHLLHVLSEAGLEKHTMACGNCLQTGPYLNDLTFKLNS